MDLSLNNDTYIAINIYIYTYLCVCISIYAKQINNNGLPEYDGISESS